MDAAWPRSVGDLANGGVGAVVLGDPAGCVLGLVDGVGDQLAHVLALDPVEDLVGLAARRDESRHPQLGQMLGGGGYRLAHLFSQLAHRDLAVEHDPEQLEPSGVGQHPEA